MERIIDPLQDKIIDTLNVGEGVGSMVVDKHNDLWLLSNGDLGAHVPFLAKINTTNDQLIFQENLALRTNGFPTRRG